MTKRQRTIAYWFGFPIAWLGMALLPGVILPVAAWCFGLISIILLFRELIGGCPQCGYPLYLRKRGYEPVIPLAPDKCTACGSDLNGAS